MKIKELAPRAAVDVLIATVISKDQPRSVQKPGFSGAVCNAKIRDETGEVEFTLWNNQIDEVQVGDVVRIEKGWVNEYKDKLQISTGKFGKLTVEKGNAEAAPAETAKKQSEDDDLSEDPVTDEEDVL